MKLTSFTGIMARRLLVNWRVAPEVAAGILPVGVRPALVGGRAIAGLCLVRLERLRPVGAPAWLGLSSENVALRMGIEWDAPGGVEKSVLILRRESPSRVNGAFCHHIGYGVHHRMAMGARDGAEGTRIWGRNAEHALEAEVVAAGGIMAGSAFGSMGAAEAFFRGSECGYSPRREAGWWDCVRLHLHRWDLRPARVVRARSTLLERMFPGAEVDSAFVMRDIEHTWTPCGRVALGMVRERWERRAAAA